MRGGVGNGGDGRAGWDGVGKGASSRERGQEVKVRGERCQGIGNNRLPKDVVLLYVAGIFLV